MRRLALLFALVSSASAQETLIRQVYDTKTDTRVEVTALFSKPAPRGYLPVRLKMANQLTSDRSVTLSFTSSFGNDSRLKSSFSFDAPAEKITEHDILVPLITTMNGGYEGPTVSVELGGSMGSSNRQFSSGVSSTQPSVLLSEPLYTPNASALDSEAKTRSSTYGGDEFSTKFDAKMLPDDWRAYSGYDSILMTDTDWTGAAPGARNAILSWVRLGGQLVIYTRGTTAASLGLPADNSFGSVVLKNLSASSLALDPNQTVDLVTKGNKVAPQQKSIMGDYSSTWPLQDAFGKQGFNYAVFIIILIAFGVVVGPVNLFVFAKSGRRHRLFVTTPLISLAASLLLIGLILVQDGFGGRGARVVLMEVRPDNGENAAYLRQEQFSRTGVLTGARFTLNDPASLSPVPIDGDNRWARLTTTNRGEGNGYTADFRDGKLETSGDWFQSRSEQGQILEAVIPTRGRIERASTTGSPQLLSTFDFPIEVLFYRDSTNQWWRAENVQPGTRFSPTTITAAMADTELDAERDRFGARNRVAFDQVRERTGSFIAITEAAPAVETYKSIKWKQSHTVLTGPVVNP